MMGDMADMVNDEMMDTCTGEETNRSTRAKPKRRKKMPSVFPGSKEAKYTDKRVVEASKKKRLPFGVHALLCVEVTPEIAKGKTTTGDMVAVCEFASLKDINDVTSTVRPLIRDRLTIPIDNPRVAGHKINEEWAPNMGINFLHSMYSEEELPAYPYFDRDEGHLVYKGKKIGPDQEDAKREEVSRAAFKIFKSLMDKPEQLKGRKIFGVIGESKPDKKTGQVWVNILSKYNIDRPPKDKDGEVRELVDLGAGGAEASTPRRKVRRGKGKGNGAGGQARPARTRRKRS